MFGTAEGDASPAGASGCPGGWAPGCDPWGSNPLPIGSLGTAEGPPEEGAGGAGGAKGAPGAGAGGVKGAGGGAGGVKGASGAGAGAEACPGEDDGKDDGKDEGPPDGLACGGGVSPGSGGTGPVGIPEPPGTAAAPEPPGAPEAPGPAEPPGAPEVLDSSDGPVSAPCPELALPEAFCVYQAGGA